MSISTTATAIRPKAYSYARFSSPQQMSGDSLRRQMGKAAAYAAAHQLDLDQTTTFQDLGVSAYRGKNSQSGRLAEFLVAVEDGLIERGSYLLVENLDRISRQAARRAAAVLSDIVDAGIAVVTLDDGKTYTEASLNDDPFAFIFVILTFCRANEESQRKSSLGQANWEWLRTKASAAHGHNTMTQRGPAWLRYDPATQKFEVIPERADVVRRIFRMIAEGQGLHRIAETLNREEVPTFGDNGTKRKAMFWHRSYVKKISENPSVIGTLVPHKAEWDPVTRKRTRRALTPIAGYYPAVVRDEEFEAICAQRDTTAAAPRAGASGIRNILAGLATCGACGSAMTRVTKGSSARSGKPYLVCSKAKAGAGCSYEAVPLQRIESALVWDASILPALVPSSDPELEGEIVKIDLQLQSSAQQVSNLLTALSFGPSEAVSQRLNTEEKQRAELRRRLDALMERAAVATPVVLKKRLAGLADMLGTGEWEAAAVNSVLRQCFKRVVVDRERAALRFEWKISGEVALPYGTPKKGFEGVTRGFWTTEGGTRRVMSDGALSALETA